MGSTANYKHSFGSPNIRLKDEDYLTIKRIIESGWVSIGEYVAKLEQKFKDRFRVKHAIACSNATTGLTIAIKAAGWRNKRVGLPAFTWPSTLYALDSNGQNTPIFCDVNSETWLMEKPVTACDCLLGVDTFGNQLDLGNDLPVIYDAAHAFGLPKLGNRGLAEVVSFSFTKLVTAMEGGIILTNDDNLADRATELRRLSGRMEEINAFVALNSMEYYDSVFENLRDNIIDDYRKGFDFNFKEQKITTTNYSVYGILFEKTTTRNAVYKELESQGIETKVYYEPLVDGLPNTDEIYSKILCLPIHENVLPIQNKIIETVNSVVAQQKTAPGKAYMKEVGLLI